MCYNETSNITERYTLISTLKTWPDAQQYCRQHHTDLVSIKSASENEDMKKKAPASPFWIGLFNNPWKWADEENSTFQKWDIGEPDNMLGNENCTMMYHTQGQWRDAPCSQRYFFFCYEGTFSHCSECHGNAVCQPSSKSVQCVCAEGFVGDGFSCYNRTECNETTDCCPHGFQWSNEHGCTDIDECAADGDLNDCPPQSSCVNTIGSFHCLLDHISKRSSRSVSFSCINQPCPSGQDCITDSCADPCQQYKVLDEPWRSTNFPIAPSSDRKCDSGLFGWYRFLVNDSVRMPEKCVPDYSCGSDATLWITGTHPVETDGIVSRTACAGWQLNCCHSSITVHIKACPGNYHVYKYQGVPWCYHVYCAEYNPTITALQTVPLSCLNQPCLSGQDCITNSCVDPCQQYNVLDEPWRSTHFPVSPSSVPKCDLDLNGWYRFLVNESVRMPEACVPEYSCGTHAPMWINGTHPLETDGIVSRQSCGKWSSSCCYFTTTVHIKACPGNYHVYKFQGTPGCNLAYCAESNLITKAPESTTEQPTETTERSTETTERPTETTERSTETTERSTETTERPTETTERSTETTERPTETTERPTETTERPTETTERSTETTEQSTETTERSTETTERPTETTERSTETTERSTGTTERPTETTERPTETTERSTETTEQSTETTERPTETTERPTETTERSTETTERPTETTERSTETTERSTETQTSPESESSPAAKAPGTTEPSTGTQTSPEPGKRRQVVRIEINAAEGLDPEDPKITDAILAQLQERLPKGMTLRWKKKDGKIFHKQEEEEEEMEMETCSKP
ncbi:uncharacterized protein LOC117967226 [Acipenser ruthenus]|uniref:uncharacterized protein LOC117967226 n=1 Tax=Acipenser ruthenus TaxID=7906 RepID=UPI0027428853|nr:uncharacterized protein LOC117967226 [Acipenser ruthenus]